METYYELCFLISFIVLYGIIEIIRRTYKLPISWIFLLISFILGIFTIGILIYFNNDIKEINLILLSGMIAGFSVLGILWNIETSKNLESEI